MKMSITFARWCGSFMGVTDPASAAAPLGELADSTRLRGVIDITGEDPGWLVAAWRRMALIRRIEETIADLVRDRLALGRCRRAVGRGGAGVGVARHVKAGDRVFGAHRSHAHFIALGGSPFELLAEVLGREPGCSSGMGGSMHLVNPEIGFYGSVPIVAATIPIAAGAALAAKLD